MAVDSDRNDEFRRIWRAIERLEDAMREGQLATNARIDRLFYAIMGGAIAIVVTLLAQSFIGG